MQLDEDSVRQALHRLEDISLAGPSRNADSRVAKYEHWMQEAINLPRGEIAVLCVLLLRGPQTVGELRGRPSACTGLSSRARYKRFDRLMQREPPLVKLLPRQPGTKEARAIELLSSGGEWTEAAPTASAAAASDGAENERIPRLETEVAVLREEVAELKQQVDKLVKLIE